MTKLNSGSPSGKTKLSDYGSNHYSQFGEDGIVEKIFGIIGVQSKVCIEFGAWDGFHLSNTANLWTKDWKGILIEGHPQRYAQLVDNVKSHNCVCIAAYVGCEGPSHLEALLAKHGIHGQIDLLSIDIDGDDYHVFASLDRLHPRVVICEYNPTIPADLDLYAERGNYFGASVAALNRVAQGKGYRLIAITDTNCFFVREEEFPKFAEYKTALGEIRVDKMLMYVMTSYRGDYVVSRAGPYGFGYPYRGGLVGQYLPAVFRTHWLHPVTVTFRHLKRIVKSIF